MGTGNIDANEFVNLLSQADKVEQWPTEQLKALAQKYPYSQPVQLLYTASLNHSSDFLFTQQLAKTSIRTDDRSLLFDLFERDVEKQGDTTMLEQKDAKAPEPRPIEIVKGVEKIEEKIEVQPKHEQKKLEVTPEKPKEVKAPIPLPVKEESKLDLTGMTPAEKVAAILAENKRIREQFASGESLKKEKKEEKKEEIIAVPVSNESVSEEPVTASEEITKEVSDITEPEFPIAEAKTLEDEVAVEENEKVADELEDVRQVAEEVTTIDDGVGEEVLEPEQPVFEIEEEEPVNVFEIEDVAEATPSQIDHSNESHSFGEWLKVLKQESSNNEVEETVEGKAEEVAEKVESKIDLIDAFVEKLPELKRKSREKPNQITSSIQWDLLDSEEDDTLVTETLAKVYIQQKHYSKAIKAFEILKLKYPEKSSFFADQILEIRKLINNK